MEGEENIELELSTDELDGCCFGSQSCTRL
jgi:hypothetical protein